MIAAHVEAVMQRLEQRDARDRTDGSPQRVRLRQVPREVGEFLHTLVLATNARRIVEIGTSGGYSTLWLALAANQTRGRVTTFDVDPAKIELARRSFADADVTATIDLRHADAREGLHAAPGTLDLVFLDAEKPIYEPLIEPIVAAPAGRSRHRRQRDLARRRAGGVPGSCVEPPRADRCGRSDRAR